MAAVKKKNPEVVVLCNTGCRPDTIAHKLSVSDAAVVGTTFKEDGKLENERRGTCRCPAGRWQSRWCARRPGRR